ncbi:MAG: hypothetical protein ABJQ29_01620 [Luteolibacter sp.]
MKKTILLTIAFAGALTSASFSQEKEIDLEARKASIPIVEARVKERYKRIEEIGSDIVRLHGRIDDQLGRMVERLSAIRDSAKSGYRVSKAKMELMAGLEGAVEAFRKQRSAVELGLRTGKSGVPREIAGEEIGHLDSHVEKHIAQMLEISKSFTQDENVEKYEEAGGGGYYDYGTGWYEDSLGISDEWRQNRRDQTMDKKQKAEVFDALDNSIERCEQLVAARREDLKKESLSSFEREVIQSELDAHLSMLRKREMQKDELVIVDEPTETTEISRDAARLLESSVSELLEDVQGDLRMVVVKHTQLNREQAKVAALKENLEARKKWLEDYEKENE